jgi:hypothetical protein
MKSTLYIILSTALLSLLTGCESHHLYKYEEYPCKDKVFQHQSKVAWVHLGDSYMNGEFFYITRDTFEDYSNLVENPHHTKYRIKNVYPENSEFKIIGYYAGVTTPCWSRCGQAYLVESVKDNNIAWIANYALDSKECKLVEDNPFENKKNVFSINGYGLGNNQEKSVDIGFFSDNSKKSFIEN